MKILRFLAWILPFLALSATSETQRKLTIEVAKTQICYGAAGMALQYNTTEREVPRAPDDGSGLRPEFIAARDKFEGACDRIYRNVSKTQVTIAEAKANCLQAANEWPTEKRRFSANYLCEYMVKAITQPGTENSLSQSLR